MRQVAINKRSRERERQRELLSFSWPTESGSIPADQVDVETEKKRSGESKHGRYEVAEYDLKLVGRSAVQNIVLEGGRVDFSKKQDIQY